MSDIKTYTPTIIAEMAFPSEEGALVSVGTDAAKSGQVYTSKDTPETAFPTQRVAVELLSTALNTRSKKILQSFEFTQSGAIQIGKYENGVSGDIKISPNGIVGRNQSGITTFAIDGDTGDAIFAGNLQSGTVVTGQVIVGDGNVIIDGDGGGSIVVKDSNGTTFIDSTGLVSTASFPNNGSVVANSGGNSIQTITTGSTYYDLTDGNTTASLSITVSRTTKVFIVGRAEVGLYEDATSGGAICYLVIEIDGSIVDSATFNGDQLSGVKTGHMGGTFGHTLSYIGSLTAGTHTIKLRAKMDIGYGSPDLDIYGFNFSYFLLGT